MKSGILSALVKVDLNTIREMSDGNLYIALLITLVIMIIQNVFTIIPLILVISLNISLFGLFNGYLWSWITSVIGGVAVFLMSRYWFQDLLLKHLNPKYQKWSAVENKGYLFVFLGRIFPFAPTSLINILAGISTVSLGKFILGTITGNMIYFFILSLFVHGFFSIQFENNITIVLCVVILLLALILWRFKSKRSRKRGKGTDLGRL
ncbi:putative membrane protein YdjX (TVP38/TMEM64 family) [Paenibacillus sp. DS2015]|uniref:TVP38/TMEM64 family protein n=1 Tax=Paenibacillus sp. DS2015 TaxID=3373917 RepID=UPI003D1E411D